MGLQKELHDLIIEGDEKKLRDGLFNMNTRRFGKVAEIMISKLYGYDIVKDELAYDLESSMGDKIEVKFSRAQSREDDITPENCLDICLKNAIPQSRKVECANYKEELEPFDCNIQQIKAFIFDRIYYGIFFDDQIAIFSMTGDDFKNIITRFYLDKIYVKSEKLSGSLSGRTSRVTKHVENCVKGITKEYNAVLKEKNKYADNAKILIRQSSAEEKIRRTLEEYIKGIQKLLSSDIAEIEKSIVIEKSTEIKESIYDIFDRNSLDKYADFPNVSPSQHRGNEDAEGQMHINSDNFRWHVEKSGFFLGWFSYKDLYELFKNSDT